MAIDWTKIYEKYKGLWVAFERANKKGSKKPILTRMPEELVTYVGFGL